MQNQTTPPTAPLLPDLTAARRSFSRVGWAMVLYTIIPTLIAYAIYYAVLEFAPNIAAKDWFLWVYALAPMYVVGVPIYFLFIKGAPKTRIEPKKLGANGFFSFLLISVTLLYAGNLIGNFLMAFVSIATGKEMANPVADMLSGSSFWINALMVAVLAPIFEELIFRKLILDRIHVWGEKTAIVFSALLFGIFHGNFYQFFYAFGIGLVFAYIYIRTGRLRYTIALHMFINGFFGVFANWVISKVPLELMEKMADQKFIESIYASEEALLEFAEQLTPHLLGLGLYFLYAFALFFMAIGGVVVYLIYRKRFILNKSECELPRGYICGQVYGAPGVMVAITLGIILIALNLIA